MKTIVAGSRSIEDYDLVKQAIINSGFEITQIVSGGARGVDLLGERWAKENNIPVERFPAQWSLYGKSAGLLRNIEMAGYAEALVAIWDGDSRGTEQMIASAKLRGKKVYVETLMKI